MARDRVGMLKVLGLICVPDQQAYPVIQSFHCHNWVSNLPGDRKFET